MGLEEALATAKKEVLVELVKMAQKRDMKGSKGSWKEFLNVYDRKFGSSMSDPSRRSTDALAAFLKTFNQKEDLKFLEKALCIHSNRDAVEKLKETSVEADSSEQRLVQLTLQHPLYLSNFLFPSYEEEWLVTKSSKKNKTTKSTSVIAVDCEMVLCEDGTEALVRVCVVDRDLQVKLDELVNPKKAVADYRSEITGITAKDLEGITCSLADVQKRMKKLLSHGTILVGHSLNNDMLALKIDYPWVIDTTLIFKYGDQTNSKRPSLNNLCKAVLGYEVRKKDAPHSCIDDACAAMKLVLAKIECGFDNVIPLVQEAVPEIEMSKLLIHGIPINVSSEGLHEVVPGDYTVEVKPNKKGGRGEKYSVFAIFENQQEADKAFEDINVEAEKDTSGLPQKCVKFQLDSGISGSLYVRKMGHDSLVQVPSRKRPSQTEEETDKSKKSKLDQETIKQTEADICDGHIQEIERLKKELRHRDKEISQLNKIIAALTRKQGL